MARNILVVEDDRNISDLIRMYLEKEGFDVRIAYDGGKAVEEYDRQAPDMVLLDIMLPVMRSLTSLLAVSMMMGVLAFSRMWAQTTIWSSPSR